MANSLTAGRLNPLYALLLRYGPPRWSHYIREHWLGQRLVIGIPFIWLLLFFVAPFLIVLKISFSEVQLAMPPYAPCSNGRQRPSGWLPRSTSTTIFSCSPMTCTSGPSPIRSRWRPYPRCCAC